MGRVIAPFGVRGQVKVQPFSAATGNLVAYANWWFGRDDDWQEYRIEQAHVQGHVLVAKLESCDDRQAAMLLRGVEVAVPREAFPDTNEGEFYWADLIGLEVTNEEGQDFGQVAQILATGANDVLVIRGERERLIPFIAAVVKRVNLAAGMITVDWGADY